MNQFRLDLYWRLNKPVIRLGLVQLGIGSSAATEGGDDHHFARDPGAARRRAGVGRDEVARWHFADRPG